MDRVRGLVRVQIYRLTRSYARNETRERATLGREQNESGYDFTNFTFYISSVFFASVRDARPPRRTGKRRAKY